MGGGQPLLNKKAFTLIELLAVIVILAIIALIAVPIILGIINDARESAKKRSIELYGKAVENAIAKSQLNGEVIPNGTLKRQFLDKVQYNGSDVVCSTNKLYADGSIYLAGCTVGKVAVDYTYGLEKEISTYYSKNLTGKIGDTLPSDKLTTAPTPSGVFDIGYLKFESVDNKTISGVELCFTRGETHYCLNSDSAAYDSNVEILEEAFSDGTCVLGELGINCHIPSDDLRAYITSDGLMHVDDDGLCLCEVYIGSEHSDFNCSWY